MQLLAFLTGLFLSGLAGLWVFFRTRSELFRLRDDLDSVEEEKDIVLDFIKKLSEDIGEGPDNDKLYKRIVRATALSCGAVSACIYEKTPSGSLRVRAVEGLFPPQRAVNFKSRNKEGALRSEFIEEVLETQELEPNEGLIGSVASSRKGVLIADARHDARVIKHNDEALKISSLIVVPMIYGDDLRGVLAVANPISGRFFSETDFSVASSLASYAALALRNSEMLNDIVEKNKLDFDLRLASSVQSYLLPDHLPVAKGLSADVKYKPHQKIGGDFYDFIALPDGAYGVVVADVSGKGVSAAIITAICQTKFSYIARANKSPAKTLKILNAEMLGMMRQDMFITMVYAVIEPGLGKIRIARAGHEAPLLYSSKLGKVEELRSSGAAVGMMDSELFDPAIEEIETDFEEGDIFTLYTDGVTEALDSAGEEFSAERLAGVITRMRRSDAAGINDGIMKALERFSMVKGSFADDLTLLTIKRG